MSVKGTAISCGFSDPFYFSKAFRKQTGRSPSDYRKGEKHEI
ncbi:MAG: AraC family transcriptional regulator [Fusicatenibacter sp.]|nr:AraC family transcriptional regulator [Fusicatenibacter sp.]